MILHGLAGMLWAPTAQRMLYDFVGSVLLVTVRSTVGIFLNALVFLPMTLFHARTRFTGHNRTAVLVGNR